MFFFIDRFQPSSFGSHTQIDVFERRNMLGVPKNVCGISTPFSCKHFVLFQDICIADDHVSENDLWNPV